MRTKSDCRSRLCDKTWGRLKAGKDEAHGKGQGASSAVKTTTPSSLKEKGMALKKAGTGVSQFFQVLKTSLNKK